MLSDFDLQQEVLRLSETARRAVLAAPKFASDAALLLADAAEELGQALRLEQRNQAAEAVFGIANQLRALAPILAAP